MLRRLSRAMAAHGGEENDVPQTKPSSQKHPMRKSQAARPVSGGGISLRCFDWSCSLERAGRVTAVPYERECWAEFAQAVEVAAADPFIAPREPDSGSGSGSAVFMTLPLTDDRGCILRLSDSCNSLSSIDHGQFGKGFLLCLVSFA